MVQSGLYVVYIQKSVALPILIHAEHHLALCFFELDSLILDVRWICWQCREIQIDLEVVDIEGGKTVTGSLIWPPHSLLN